MAMNALVDSFCHNQKKCGTERVKLIIMHVIRRYFLVQHIWITTKFVRFSKVVGMRSMREAYECVFKYNNNIFWCHSGGILSFILAHLNYHTALQLGALSKKFHFQ